MVHLVIHCRDLTSVVVPGHLIFCNKTYDFKVASTPRWRNLKMSFHSVNQLCVNVANVFRPHTGWRNFKTITGSFVNSVREITWLSWRHRFRKLSFQNVFRPHENEKPVFSNSSGLKSVFEKLLFRDGLVWRVGLTVEIKLRFQISLA